MVKKFLYVLIILLFSISFFNISYATDILEDLNNSTTTSLNSNQANSENIIDNTIYSANLQSTDNTTADVSTDYMQPTTSTVDYEDSSDLSISNMINIILIAVGIVLIFLGIAIIIKK